LADLPTGTVTFLFTDLEGSTRLLKGLGRDRYARLLEEQQGLLRSGVGGGGARGARGSPVAQGGEGARAHGNPHGRAGARLGTLRRPRRPPRRPYLFGRARRPGARLEDDARLASGRGVERSRVQGPRRATAEGSRPPGADLPAPRSGPALRFPAPQNHGGAAGGGPAVRWERG